MTSTVLRLDGCRPEPLGSYLRAIGVLRLLGEQADPVATGWWACEAFHVASDLDRESLLAFFLQRYSPSPLVAPWNKGSGFKEEKNPSAVAALGIIEASTDERLGPYRLAIAIGRDIYGEGRRMAWDKRVVVEACRGRLPDEAVAWVDATVVLAGDDPSYPPMMGTGGNDGRFDFSVAFMQRLADVLGLSGGRHAPTPATSRAWLEAALFADTDAQLIGEAVGQFDPGGAGGVNSSPLGPAPSLVNPWSWVLLIEGALLFASAAARRLGAGARGRAAIPFTVDASHVGYASASGAEGSRGEVWSPLWERPTTAGELTHLVGEGRSEWHGKEARSGLDMARAAATLGVDRGISAFGRHALVERNGLATVAVPVGRIRVIPRPEVPVVGQLDRWLEQVRRPGEKPAAVAAGIHRVDSLLFDLAVRGGRDRLTELLCAVADLEAVVGRTTQFREAAHVRPVQGLPATDWMVHLDDGSHEVRLAAALASMADPGRPTGADEEEDAVGGTSLRSLLRPVTLKGRQWTWSPSPAPVPGFGLRPLHETLAAAHARRVIDLAGWRPSIVDGGEGEKAAGLPTAFRRWLAAPRQSVARFVADQLDDHRLGRLLAAMLLLDWSHQPDVSSWYEAQPVDPAEPIVPAWWLLAPFFCGRPGLLKLNRVEVRLAPEASWPALLEAQHTRDVVTAALRRLRMARLRPVLTDASVDALTGPAAPAGPRLGAALLCPIDHGTGSDLLRRVAHVDQPDYNNQEDQE